MNVRKLCLHQCRNRTANQFNLSTTTSTFICQSKTHLSRGIIADETHGVYLFIGGTSRDEHLLALHAVLLSILLRTILLREELLQTSHDVLWLLHSSFALQFRCQEACARLDNMVAIRLQSLQILLRGRMCIHVQIHCRSNEHRRLHRKICGDEHVVSHTVCHLTDSRSRSWSYQHHVCPQTEIHVRVPRAIALSKEFADDGLAR